ncbi:MAG: amino acid ABC transporter substrate-binding protein, partial [SAR324 cluster bacterium]|nr:amino acid ABC transporter substrate-binding protein [SAR324 cluster bacterium]
IRHVGNYGEIYERHLGMDSPFKLPRGLNDLWSRGGLMYAPPFR